MNYILTVGWMSFLLEGQVLIKVVPHYLVGDPLNNPESYTFLEDQGL